MTKIKGYEVRLDLQFLIILKSAEAPTQISQMSSENIAVSSKTDKLLKQVSKIELRLQFQHRQSCIIAT